ncbi:MAG: hypothetical protein NZ898_02335 [Myxococcota bacterium]|nr:hypothetical protein [Myxococcota bacterium]MDW8361108.1 hypothetical protein [Myxococcales bacterium]
MRTSMKWHPLLWLVLVVGCDCGDGTTPSDAGPADVPVTDRPAVDVTGEQPEEPDGGGPCVRVRTLGADGRRASPDGIGGSGDLEIVNGVLRAVIAAPARTAHYAASGGTLVDLHLLGEGDSLNELSQLGSPAQASQVRYTELEVVEQSEMRAIVEVRGHVQLAPRPPGGTDPISPHPGTNLAVTTRYEVRCGERVVHLESTLTNASTTEVYSGTALRVLDLMLWGGRSLQPFCPVAGQGDRCRPFDFSNPLASLVRSPYIGSTGSVAGPPASFAFYPEDPTAGPFVGVHSSQVSTFGHFEPGVDYLFMGESRTYRRAIAVGGRADGASSIDVALEALAAQGRLQIATVTGRVAPAPAVGGRRPLPEHLWPMVLLATPAAEGDPLDPARWTPITIARVGSDGRFTARVIAGRIGWELRAPGRPARRGDGGSVEPGGTLDLGVLDVPELPVVSVSVRERTASGPVGLPARVTVVGVDGTPTPQLGPDGGPSPSLNLALTDGFGELELRLPEGRYDVYATHGQRYTVARRRIDVGAAGGSVELELVRLDVVPPDMLTADFHVHGAASFDSSLPDRDRLLSYLAEGVDVVVSTEHDVVHDYADALAALEAELPPTRRGALRAFVGVEVTNSVPHGAFPNTIGHYNAYPLAVVSGARAGGAPDDEYVEPGALYDRIRALVGPAGTPLVQLNHGRSIRAGVVWLGYFDSCGFDPTEAIVAAHPCWSGVSAAGTRPWDIDAMEVLNGVADATYINNLRDWLAVLRQAPGGRLPVATANSDSHRLVFDQAGMPVTVLRVPEGLAGLTATRLRDALGSGAVAGMAGPFVWARAREVGSSASPVEPGRTVLRAPSGRVELALSVHAAPWIPVDEIRVRWNGEVVVRIGRAMLAHPTDPFGTEGVVRFERTVALPAVGSDGFIVAEAGFALGPVADVDGDGVADATDRDGDGDIDAEDARLGGIDLGAVPEPLGTLFPSARPVGFTNPIFVDVDGDGDYDPPNSPLPPEV